jgi:hypothetical protein
MLVVHVERADDGGLEFGRAAVRPTADLLLAEDRGKALQEVESGGPGRGVHQDGETPHGRPDGPARQGLDPPRPPAAATVMAADYPL